MTDERQRYSVMLGDEGQRALVEQMARIARAEMRANVTVSEVIERALLAQERKDRGQ